MKFAAAVLCITLFATTSADAKTRDAGPDLPWSCWVVRANAAARGFTTPLTGTMRKQIAALEKEHGITPKQHEQAKACFAQPKAAKTAKPHRARHR